MQQVELTPPAPAFVWNSFTTTLRNSVVEQNSMGSLDPQTRSGSGSRRAKMTHKNRKKLIVLFDLLDILFWWLKASPGQWTLQLLIKKRYKNFSAVFFSSILGHENPGSVSGITWNGSGSGSDESGCTTLLRTLLNKISTRQEVEDCWADPWMDEDRFCAPGEEVEAGHPALLVRSPRLRVQAYWRSLWPHWNDFWFYIHILKSISNKLKIIKILLVFSL